MKLKLIGSVRLRQGCAENWARLSRPEDPAEIASAVLSDADGSDITLERGLPISWHRREGRYEGKRFYVVYTPCADTSGSYAHVSYVIPVATA